MKETLHNTVTGCVEKLPAAEQTTSESKIQCCRFSYTFCQELHFHKMTPKSTEILHTTTYFKPQVQKARTLKFWKTAEENNKVIKGCQPHNCL